MRRNLYTPPTCRVNMDSSYIERISAHYQETWGRSAQTARLQKGPISELPPGFHLLLYPPTTRRRKWTYATCGMSEQPDAPAIELHLFSPTENEAHVELLTAIAHYHLTGDYLNLGHTVNFGRP